MMYTLDGGGDCRTINDALESIKEGEVCSSICDVVSRDVIRKGTADDNRKRSFTALRNIPIYALNGDYSKVYTLFHSLSSITLSLSRSLSLLY